ncbi:helix-turn-helix domain-containing protein [Microbacterium sp.]|uniref:helix-turn-helix domain-containing protein n=1 Tax=Microbacterium sp. TaxID=51671 RepID=UPI0028128E9A|nr:helix-turn-helix domain-containing protein [Microbacterium sp.]
MTETADAAGTDYENPPVWRTIPQVAAHYGMGASTIRRYIAQGILPAHRFARNVRLDLREVDRLMKR